MTKRALILFAHGARDPRWAAPFQQLRDMTQAQLPEANVSLAFLELMSPRLPESVALLAGEGCTDVTVVPVFLGQGGHVLRDLPEIVTQLKRNFPHVKVKVVDAVGENPEVMKAIVGYCVSSLQATPGR